MKENLPQTGRFFRSQSLYKVLSDASFSVLGFHLGIGTIDECHLRWNMPAINIINNRDLKFIGKFLINIFLGVVMDRLIGKAPAEHDSRALFKPAGQLHLHKRPSQICRCQFTIFQIPQNRFFIQKCFSEVLYVAKWRADQMSDRVDASAEQSALYAFFLFGNRLPISRFRQMKNTWCRAVVLPLFLIIHGRELKNGIPFSCG